MKEKKEIYKLKAILIKNLSGTFFFFDRNWNADSKINMQMKTDKNREEESWDSFEERLGKTYTLWYQDFL